jgi:hypothetical protein
MSKQNFCNKLMIKIKGVTSPSQTSTSFHKKEDIANITDINWVRKLGHKTQVKKTAGGQSEDYKLENLADKSQNSLLNNFESNTVYKEKLGRDSKTSTSRMVGMTQVFPMSICPSLIKLTVSSKYSGNQIS